MNYSKPLLVLSICLILLIAPVLAWSDSMENQGTYTYSLYGNTVATYSTMYSGIGTSFPEDLYGYLVYTTGGMGGLVSPRTSPITYFAATIEGYNPTAPGYGGAPCGITFDTGGSVITSFNAGEQLASLTKLHRFESVISGTNIKTYWDGYFSQTISTTTATPYYFSYGPFRGGSSYWVYISDYSASNAFSDTGIVSVMPHTYTIQKSILTPTQVLLKDASGNTVYSDHFNVRWAVGPYNDGWDITAPPNTRYAISLFTPSGLQAYTGYINFTQYGSAAGVLPISFNSTYLGNQPLEYGIYHVYLYDNGGTKSSDYFSVISSGASIYWGASQYASGAQATVTYSVDSGYWDTANYAYSIKIVNIYGTTMDSKSITTQSGATTFTLTDYDAGAYYAELVATPTAGGTAAILYYAVTQVTNYVTFAGAVTDQAGNVLPGAIVNITQLSTVEADTSGSGGLWNSTTNWLAGYDINITTTLSGYEPTIRLLHPLSAAGLTNYNITLLNSNRTCPDTCIDGLTFGGAYNSTIPAATVNIIENISRSNPQVNTSNLWGYYRFSGLTAGVIYDDWSSKTGYGNSTIKQVTPT